MRFLVKKDAKSKLEGYPVFGAAEVEYHISLHVKVSHRDGLVDLLLFCTCVLSYQRLFKLLDGACRGSVWKAWCKEMVGFGTFKGMGQSLAGCDA